jgi:hypothetical protein
MYRFGLLQRDKEPLFNQVVRLFAAALIISSFMEVIF